MTEPTASQRLTPPDEEWAKEVCKLGQGNACCRYLAFSNGYTCEKHTPLGRTLDQRVVSKTMHARGDNCAGRATRIYIDKDES